MKFLFAVSMICSFNCSAQSNIFIEKKMKSPDAKDSLLIYYNSIQVNNFFDNNKLYTKISEEKIENKNELYNSLESARSIFYKVRKDGSLKNTNDPDSIKINPGYRDIAFKEYYKKVDDYRFFQRELENQVINATSPMPLYDFRICPIVINKYKCEDKSSIYFGDIVNIPMYIPVLVKPYSMLTEEEIISRAEIFKNYNQSVVDTEAKNETSSVYNENNYRKGSAVFYFNNAGSGSIIGFMNSGVFRKVRKEEYKEYVVMKYAQEFLENEERLNNWLKAQYGGYCVFVK